MDSRLDDTTRERYLDLVRHEFGLPGHGRLGPLIARIPEIRDEARAAANRIAWDRIRDTTLTYVQDSYVAMLVAIRRFFGPAGERLVDELGLRGQPQAGDVIRTHYVWTVLLTRQPDPWPWLRFIYATATVGPLAERELLRRLQAIHGGEVPRILAPTAVLAADKRAQAWTAEVVPGLDLTDRTPGRECLESERNAALSALTVKVHESLRKNGNAAYRATRARVARDEGIAPEHASAKEQESVLRDALAAWTLLGVDTGWGAPIDDLIAKALKGQLAIAPTRLADRFRDRVRACRRWQDRVMLADDPGSDTVSLTIAETWNAVSLKRWRDEPDQLEAKFELDAIERFLQAHPQYRKTYRLLTADKRVKDLARSRSVTRQTIRNRRLRFRAAYLAHVTGADGCRRETAP